jgi:hypothetical protein
LVLDRNLLAADGNDAWAASYGPFAPRARFDGERGDHSKAVAPL